MKIPNLVKSIGFISALRKGQSLKNPATWKNVVLVTQLITGLLLALNYGLQFLWGIDLAATMGNEQFTKFVHTASKWIAEGMLIYTTYFFVATSEKVGV